MTIEQLVQALATAKIEGVIEIEATEMSLYRARPVSTVGVNPVVRSEYSCSLKYTIPGGGTVHIGEIKTQAGVVLGFKPFTGATYIHVKPVVDLIEKGA